MNVSWLTHWLTQVRATGGTRWLDCRKTYILSATSDDIGPGESGLDPKPESQETLKAATAEVLLLVHLLVLLVLLLLLLALLVLLVHLRCSSPADSAVVLQAKVHAQWQSLPEKRSNERFARIMASVI